MKQPHLNADGIAHLFVIAILAVSAVGTGSYVLVSKHSHQNSQVSQTKAGRTENTRQTVNHQNGAQLSTASPVADNNASQQTSSPQPAPVTLPKKTDSKPLTSTTKKPAATSPSPMAGTSDRTPAAQQPSQTPLSALTVVVSGLYDGDLANVTAARVTVAGPVGDAHARPLVFTANGKTYFAYSQGNAVKFNTSPAQTAGSMAIIPASGNPALEQAHLDKSDNLVDTDFMLVGYSQ